MKTLAHNFFEKLTRPESGDKVTEEITYPQVVYIKPHKVIAGKDDVINEMSWLTWGGVKNYRLMKEYTIDGNLVEAMLTTDTGGIKHFIVYFTEQGPKVIIDVASGSSQLICCTIV
jgi:hypothetical protein